MLTKSTIRSAGVVIGTFLLATGSVVSYGEGQSEWLQKQLQTTDGYVSELSASVPGNAVTSSPYEGASVIVPASAAEKANKKGQAGKPAARSGMQFRGDERMFASDGM